MRALPLIVGLLTLTALSGCAGGDPRADPRADESSPAVAPDPASPADVAPAGAHPAPASRLATATCTGEVAAGAGVMGNLQMGFYCPFAAAAVGDLSGHAAVLVEVRWPDAVPTQTSFNLFLLSDSCNFTSPEGSCNLDFSGDPASEFRYMVPTGLLRSDGDDGLRVYVSFDGPAVDQTVQVAVTLVPAGGVLPADHSALPA